MKQPIVKGHPLHAMATDVPVASFMLSYCFDVLSMTTSQKDAFRDAATANCAATFVGGAAAVGLGWWDFFNIPEDHPAHAPALIHGAMNSGVAALIGANVVARLRQPRLGGTSALPFALSTVAILGLVAGAWLGGNLVYEHGWRVRKAEKLELMEPELEKDGHGEYATKAQAQVEEFEKRSALIA